MTLYNRSASLEIQSATPGQVVLVEGFRIIFSVTKTEDKTPNTAKIEIYNLNEVTRNLIRLDDDPKTDQLVTLNAGYLDESGEEVLFIGTMSSVYHKFIRPNVISVIEANDGKGSLDKTKVSISQPKDSSAIAALKNVIGEFPIPSNLDTIPVIDKLYKSGFVHTGMGKKALDKVCDFLGLSWSTQNNELHFIPFDGTDNTSAISITPASGMLKSPERLSGETRKAKKKTKKVKPGWKVDSLLIPRILPNGLVSLASREIPTGSLFIVKSVSHTGDTHGHSWNSIVEVHEK